jgi:hypothetical protein
VSQTPASVEAMYSDDHAPTADLDEFLAAYAEDDNWWWRIACGHHMNLFDDAVGRIEQATLQHAPADFQPDMCVTCLVTMPCPTLLALRGGP